MDVLQDFAERLSKLHRDSGLSQDEAVAMIGRATGEVVHQTTFSNWLRGKKEPTLSNLVVLALAYNVSLDYLVGSTREPTPAARLACRVDELSLPPVIQGAAKKLAQLSEVSQRRIVAEVEDRYRNEQRWQQIESLVEKMDTDGTIASRILGKLDELSGLDGRRHTDPVTEFAN